MSQREKYFAAKVAKMLAEATAQPEVLKGGIVHTFIQPSYIEPDVVQVADPVTGVITKLI